MRGRPYALTTKKLRSDLRRSFFRVFIALPYHTLNHLFDPERFFVENFEHWQGRAPHQRQRCGHFQPPADIAQNVDDGTFGQSFALVHISNQFIRHISLQRRFWRRWNEPTRSSGKAIIFSEEPFLHLKMSKIVQR